jgi:hypothetical protein
MSFAQIHDSFSCFGCKVVLSYRPVIFHEALDDVRDALIDFSSMIHADDRKR